MNKSSDQKSQVAMYPGTDGLSAHWKPVKQFLMFLFTGGLAAAVNFSSRILYNFWMDFTLAIIIAYLTGMVTAFVLAKTLVFKHSKQPWQRSGGMFCLVNLVAVVQTWLISLTLAHFLPVMGITQYVPEISHGIGVVIPVFTSYIGHKRWSFR